MTNSPAIPASEADEVMRLVYGWLADQDSPHTRTAYARDLAGITQEPKPGHHRQPRPMPVPSWLDWCRAAGISPLTAVRAHVALYARTLEDAGLSQRTRARKLSAISSWYKYLVEDGVLESSPANVKRPKVDRDARVSPSLTREQVQALLATADAAPTSQQARNSALVATLLLTGARVSEAVTATTDELGIDRGHRVLWVTRKGGKRQSLALPGPAAERIDAYLASRPGLTPLPVPMGQAGLTRHPLLFATEDGNGLSQADVWKTVRSLARRAGFPPELVNHLTVHSLRSTFITLSLDAGAPLRDVQDAAGHVSADTTRGYDRARHNLDRAPGWALAAYLSAQ